MAMNFFLTLKYYKINNINLVKEERLHLSLCQKVVAKKQPEVSGGKKNETSPHVPFCHGIGQQEELRKAVSLFKTTQPPR